MSENATADAPETTAKPEGYAKYKHLRANVRRRRAWYGTLILLSIVVLAVSIVDIGFVDSAMEYGVYGAYAFLFLIAILMLISRSRKEEVVEEGLPQPKEMDHILLQCPSCENNFEYAQPDFASHKEVSISCPVCGVFSKLPGLNMEPVKVLTPDGPYKELRYRDSTTGDEIAVGTYGETPLNLVRFRASPVSGEKGVIERLQTPPPEDFVPPEPSEEENFEALRQPVVRRGPIQRQEEYYDQ